MQAQKWVRKPGSQGATSRIGSTTGEQFVSWFCHGFHCSANSLSLGSVWFSPMNFLEILFGERLHRVDSLELVNSRREIHHLTGKRERRCHSSGQNLFEELNSDKSPRSEGIHSIASKKFEAAALVCISECGQVVFSHHCCEENFCSFFSKILSASG